MKRYTTALAAGVLLLTFGAVSALAQKARASVSAAEVTGTFRMNFKGRFRDTSSDIKIASVGRGRLRIAMDLIYPYRLPNGDDLANTGQLDGEATIVGDTATYKSTEFGQCTIMIKFIRPGQIKVTQQGDDSECGFGHNVTADGSYRKVSSRKPNFERVE